jgi:transporter family-2 protein
MAGLTLAQKMGSGIFTGVTVTSAIVVSILLDNYALMGFRQHPASITRIAGAALMIVGLMARRQILKRRWSLKLVPRNC